MTGPKHELLAIEDALIESILAASPEETLEDLREQGIDPVALLARIDAVGAEAASKARSKRLADAKARAAAFKAIQGGGRDAAPGSAPRMDREAVRSRLREAPLMLAARKGTGMSERDEETLAEDLADLDRLKRDPDNT